MTVHRALVSGASIAGLTTAYWLERIGWHVDVLERAPAFREGGQNVDVRGMAREVIARMGLAETVRALTTTEEGTRFVDTDGATIGEFPAREGNDGLTAELEILRGDLAGSIRDLLGDTTTIRFGEQIAALTGTGHVSFGSGDTAQYDLVVVAEGVRSSTRDLLFAGEVKRDPLNLTVVYGTIERTETDDRWWNWYTADEQRQVALRPDNTGTIRATLAYLDEDDDLAEAGEEQRSARLRRVFAGAGWQTDRVLCGFEQSDDVHVDCLTQIRMRTWSRGRVVVVGDAAWCVTPLGGGGASLALVGPYVLAAYLSEAPGDLEGALRSYEQWMRPVVDRTQRLPPGVPRLAFPKTQIGVRLQHAGVRIAGSEPGRAAVSRLTAKTADTGQELPWLRAASG